jgi:integrase
MPKKSIKKAAKSPVYVREKTLANGGKSLFLDIHKNGVRVREYLKLYIVPEKTPLDKKINAETRTLAETIKAQRIIDFNTGKLDLPKMKNRNKADFLTFAKIQADKKKINKRGETSERGTYLTYKSFIFHFKQYAGENTTFNQIDKAFCMGFIDYLQTAKNTRDGGTLKTNSQLNYIKTFSAILESAIKAEIIITNPMKLCDKPQRQSHDITFLDLQELAAMENKEIPCNYDVKKAFLFSCYTGMRFSDIKGLQWNNFIEISGQLCAHIRQRKTNAIQYLPISDKAKSYLPDRPDYAADTETVFNLSTNGYTNIYLKSWARESGVTKQISFHTARHTAATLLLALGENIKTISGILGHANSAITEKHYAALQIAPLAAAMNKMNNL